MLPLSSGPSLPQSSISGINAGAKLDNKETILVPLIEKSSDGTFIWNLKQDPALITEGNFEKDLQISLRNAIEKRGPIYKTNLVDFKHKFLIACEQLMEMNTCDRTQWKWKSLLIESVIPTLEELIWRDDIDFKTDLTEDVHEDFFNVEKLKNLDFEIHNDHEAYTVFLLYIVCILTHDGQHNKFFNEIKTYNKKNHPYFDDHFFIKKMTFLGLARTMDKEILIKMLSREIEKKPGNTSLMVTLHYVEQKNAQQREVTAILISATEKMLHFFEKYDFKAFLNHFQMALNVKASVLEYQNFLATYSLKLISFGKRQIVLEMCDMILTIYPNSKSILKIKESIQNGHLNNLIGLQSQLYSFNKVSETNLSSNTASDKRKLYDFTGQSALRPLLSYDEIKGFTWDFQQNEWLLDKDTWSTRLTQDFFSKLEKQYPDLKTKSYRNQVNKLEKVNICPNGFFDISGTSFISLMPAKKGQIYLVDLFDRLFLQKMWGPLSACLFEALKTINRKHFTSSEDSYIFYICLMAGLYQKDKTKLQPVDTFLELYKRNSSCVFLEKLHTLIYAASLIGSGVEDQRETISQITDFLDLSLVKINTSNLPSLLILKAEYLIDLGNYKQCRTILERLPAQTKERPEYLKALCQLEFACGAWQEAIKIGEKYFELSNREDLSPEDLPVGYALSTMYRYNEIIGNGELIRRLINSLSSPTCDLYHENYLRHFFSIIFNIYYNTHAVEFSTHQIPFVDGESAFMRSIKEVILHYLNRLTLATILPKNNSTIDSRINTLLDDQMIPERKEASYIAELCYTTGCANFIKKNYTRAIELFETVDKMVHHHMHALECRVRTLLHLEEFAKAYPLLKRCLKNSFIQKNWIELHVACLVGLNRKEEALAVAKKGYEEYPKTTMPLLQVINILSQLGRGSELIEVSRVVLNLDLKRDERLDVIRCIFDSLLKVEPDYLESHLKPLLNNSGDELELETFYLLSMIQIRNKNIQKAKELLTGYNKNDYVKFFLQASIEHAVGENEQALISLSKSLELKPKVKDKENYDSLNFFIPEVDFKKLQYLALAALGRSQEFIKDNFNWVHHAVPEQALLVVFKLYLAACNEHQKLDLGLRACDKLLKTFKHSTYIKTARENIHAELENEKAATLAANSISPAENSSKAQIDLSAENAEPAKKTEKERQEDISFVFSKKPKLYLEKKKENDASFKVPTHPALIKQMEAELKQAKIDISEMYRLDPTQLEIYYPMSALLARRFEPLAEYGKDETIDIEKSAPKPPKEQSAKTAAKEPAPAVSSRLSEVPKRITKSIALASKELGIEIPPAPESPYLKRFKGAQVAASEINKHLMHLMDVIAQVHPIYRNPDFSSRFLTIHLFRLAELMKPTKKGLCSEGSFRVHVHQIFRDYRNVVLLRNLITLHGHRTSYVDLKQFCQYVVNSKIADNLNCLIDDKKPHHPPLDFDLRKLFPYDFKLEWDGLTKKEQRDALLTMITYELEFVSTLATLSKPDLFENKGHDVCEILKLSVLRIGKALTYIKKNLKIGIYDPALIELIEASIKVRHQITKSNSNGLPRELQPQWLSHFMNRSEGVRSRMEEYFGI